MSGNKRRKTTKAPLLDYEKIKASTKQSKEYFEDFQGSLQKLKDVDLERLLSMSGCGLVLNEDDALLLLGSKLTVSGLNNLKKCLKHIPQNITRIVDGIPLRMSLIQKMFNSKLAAGKRPVTIEELSVLVKFIETFCPLFLVEDEESQDHLWGLSQTEENFFNRFLTPPVSLCTSCDRPLTIRNKPSKAKLFTLRGPLPCTKVTLECRNCNLVYGPCNYRGTEGMKLYSKGVHQLLKLVEVSDVTYIELDLYNWFPAFSNHCWVSFSGFTEAYNDICEQMILKYKSLLQNQTSKQTEFEMEEMADDDGESSQNIVVLPGEMSAKVLARCFWRNEVHEELSDIGLQQQWTFSKNVGPLSGSYDEAMSIIDKSRCNQLYCHNCSSHCKTKGCGELYVADGNWKLRYAHCMWKVPVSVSGFGDINYPNICPLSPKRGHAFCDAHCAKANAIGIPSSLKEFYMHCGIKNTDVNTELEEMSQQSDLTDTARESIDSCLENISRSEQDDHGFNASTFQGTVNFLKENPEFVKDQTMAETLCNKDTGGLKTFYSWSRGLFFIVSAGGHIEYWQPLYRSESPTQAFLVTVLWLHRKFKGMKETHSDEEIIEAMSKICLAYDNMCHLDALKITKQELPFPEPFNKTWALIKKVIDRLHLRNHVDPKCKVLYNPEDKIPVHYNTMACEQTFIWASRFKKVICAMPQVHQFFFLHRIIKCRNKYTEKCHRQKKVPVLPKLGKGLNKQ